MGFQQMPDGSTVVTLPNGVTRVYDESELADFTVELIHRAHVDPNAVDENWHEIVRAAVGEVRWAEACRVVASIIK